MKTTQIFECVVDEVTGDSFWATMYDLTEPKNSPEFAEFSLADFDEEIEEGMVFEWIIESESRFVVRHQVKYSQDQLDLIKKQAKELAELYWKKLT